MSCEDEDIYIVGGANSAGQAAMYFAKYARSVVMLVRGDSLSAYMSQYLIDQIKKTPNIHVETHSQVVEAHGDTHLEAISILCSYSGETPRFPPICCRFSSALSPIRTGSRAWWSATSADLSDRNGPGARRKKPAGWPLNRDPFWPETSVPGIFAAGDVRHGSVKRVASGVGEGSIAVQFTHQYLSEV